MVDLKDTEAHWAQVQDEARLQDAMGLHVNVTEQANPSPVEEQTCAICYCHIDDNEPYMCKCKGTSRMHKQCFIDYMHGYVCHTCGYDGRMEHLDEELKLYVVHIAREFMKTVFFGCVVISLFLFGLVLSVLCFILTRCSSGETRKQWFVWACTFFWCWILSVLVLLFVATSCAIVCGSDGLPMEVYEIRNERFYDD